MLKNSATYIVAFKYIVPRLEVDVLFFTSTAMNHEFTRGFHTLLTHMK